MALRRRSRLLTIYVYGVTLGVCLGFYIGLFVVASALGDEAFNRLFPLPLRMLFVLPAIVGFCAWARWNVRRASEGNQQ